MKSFKSILLMLMTAAAISLSLPFNTSAGSSCTEECEFLCGEPTDDHCQYTTCEGASGTVSCVGEWQHDDPGEG